MRLLASHQRAPHTPRRPCRHRQVHGGDEGEAGCQPDWPGAGGAAGGSPPFCSSGLGMAGTCPSPAGRSANAGIGVPAAQPPRLRFPGVGARRSQTLPDAAIDVAARVHPRAVHSSFLHPTPPQPTTNTRPTPAVWRGLLLGLPGGRQGHRVHQEQPGRAAVAVGEHRGGAQLHQ